MNCLDKAVLYSKPTEQVMILEKDSPVKQREVTRGIPAS